MNYTQQGIARIKESPARLDAAKTGSQICLPLPAAMLRWTQQPGIDAGQPGQRLRIPAGMPPNTARRKELEYGRRDVERTVALLNAMKREYDGFPIRLQPGEPARNDAYSRDYAERLEGAAEARPRRRQTL
jgi:hypothetical protein